MKKEHKELYEDVLEEVTAIEETLERLCEIRNKFDPQIKDHCITLHLYGMI